MVSRSVIRLVKVLGICLCIACETVKVSAPINELSKDEISKMLEIIKPTLVLLEDFEDGSYSDSGKCSGNCPEIVRDSSDDNRFLQASLSGGDKVKNRTELSLNPSVNLEMNRIYLISFKVRFNGESVEGFPPSMFFQVHARNWKEKNSPNTFWQPVVGRVRNGALRQGFWQSEKINGQNQTNDFSYSIGTWHHCLVFFRLSNTHKGSIKTYRDGKLEFEGKGSNSGNWKHPQFPKFGIYKGKRINIPKNAQRIIDYDNIEVYDLTELVGSEKLPPFVSQIFY